jgi:hypothetical protein
LSHSIERQGEKAIGNPAPQGNAKGDLQSIFLDPWLTAKGDPLVALVDNLMPILQPRQQGRIRSERRDAIRNRHTVVSNIAANLTLLALGPNQRPGSLLAVSTAKTKATRYDRADYPQTILGKTIEAMEEAGLLTRHPWAYKQKCTTVEPTKLLTDMLHHHGVRLQDIGRDAGGETIWLRARNDGAGWESENRRRYHGPAGKILVHYDDTEETIRLRAEVERINAALNDTSIAIAGEPTGPIALWRTFLMRSPRDPHAFNLGGRVWGGFWQTIKKDRRHLITIDGEEVADLDFKAMFAMLAYLKATGRLPSGDPYAVPGLEDHRDGAKLALISLLSRIGSMERLAPGLKALLPEGWTAWMLEGAMSDYHRPIAHLFGKDIGIELMHTEGRVLMALLLYLADRGIPALPMHDGINVRASDRDAAMQAMRVVSERLLGVALPVVEKPIRRPPAIAAAA